MRRLPLLAALLLAACNTNVDPQFRVDDVRVLAIRSGVLAGLSADVAPGDTLVLDALVANPRGRPGLTVEWFLCLPDPSQAVSPCEDLATLADPALLRSNPKVVALAAPGPHQEYLVPPIGDALWSRLLAPALRFPVFACSAYAEIDVAVYARAGDRSSVATKAVRVKPPATVLAALGVPDLYVLNLNPIAETIFRAPADPDSCTGGVDVASGPFPVGKTDLCGTGRSGSVQSYVSCDPGGDHAKDSTVEEVLSWQWYVSDGDFPKVGGVGNARGIPIEFTRPPGAFTLWGILRDGRGGDDWIEVLVSAAP